MSHRPMALTLAVLAAAAGGLTSGTARALAQEEARPRIAVLDFGNASAFTYWGDRLGEAAADELTTQLVKTGKFHVMDRRRLRAILADSDLELRGAVDPNVAVEIGRLLGVQAIVTGTITRFDVEGRGGKLGPVSTRHSKVESVLDVRLVNATTGAVMLVADGDGKERFRLAVLDDSDLSSSYSAGVAQESLRPAVKEAARKIGRSDSRLASIAPAAPPGMVISADGDEVYIDRGSNYEVQVGQRFDVYRATEGLRGDDGSPVGAMKERVGRLEVVKVLPRAAVCRLLEGEAEQGDEVRSRP